MIRAIKQATLGVWVLLAGLSLFGCASTGATEEQPQAFTGRSEMRSAETPRGGSGTLGGKTIHQYGSR